MSRHLTCELGADGRTLDLSEMRHLTSIHRWRLVLLQRDSSWARFGVFKPHVNGTDSSIRTPALDDFLNTGKKTPKKPPLSTNSRATPMPLHVSHIPFIANYWGFLLLFIKKHISLYLQFTVKLLAQFPILEFYFLTLACYFVGLKTFFFFACYSLDCKDLSADVGGGGTRTQRPTAAATPRSRYPLSDSGPRSIASPARWRARLQAEQSFTGEQCSLLVPLRHSFVTTVVM